MSVTRGREAAFFFSNYRIRVLRFLYGTLLSAYQKNPPIYKPKIDRGVPKLFYFYSPLSYYKYLTTTVYNSFFNAIDKIL